MSSTKLGSVAAAADPNRFLDRADAVLTTYAMLARQEWLSSVTWGLVVLDEAQAIRNPSARLLSREVATSMRGRAMEAPVHPRAKLHLICLSKPSRAELPPSVTAHAASDWLLADGTSGESQ